MASFSFPLFSLNSSPKHSYQFTPPNKCVPWCRVTQTWFKPLLCWFNLHKFMNLSELHYFYLITKSFIVYVQSVAISPWDDACKGLSPMQYILVVTRYTLKPNQSWLNSQLCHLLALWPWASYLLYWSINFFLFVKCI